MDLALLLSSLGLGLRHGVDWDHISAITDITGTEVDKRRAAVLALLYALGHGAAVMALGAVAIAAGARLPAWTDNVMERVVGLTLIALAVFLVRSLRRGERTSRGLMLLTALRRTRERMRRTHRVEIEHTHPEGHARVATTHVHKVDLTTYTPGAAVAVGVLHGIGAETGTQAIVLVSAAGVASTAAGLGVLVAFVAGIIVTTGGLAVMAAFGWNVLAGRGRAYQYLTAATALFSATVGVVFVTGNAGRLPGLL
ncbi:MAG TPA: hypothetical protein VHD87_17665 [Acidimicrobiales bacterium]|nr:hypothetical protein [Acidimicrobiales bacterium]